MSRAALGGWGAALVLCTSLVACGPTQERAARRPPNVIVWLVDTLRADHLSCYGYERDTSPQLDALAAQGVLFENAHVNSNWTQPSVVSLLSGRAPPIFESDYSSTIPEGLTLLPEWLRFHGWRTAGFTITAATASHFGFDKGFGEYVELDADLDFTVRTRRSGPEFDADRVVAAALDWIDTRAAAPFFLSLHSVDPHAPYEAHVGEVAYTDPTYAGPQDGSLTQLDAAFEERRGFSAADRRQLIDLYDGEIRYSDTQLGALVAGLRARDLFDNTLLVVVSDHGEEFWDHRTHGHGHRNLHAELTHVPLVMSWPDGLPAGLRVPGLMRGIDLTPTLVHALGLPALPDAEGESVLLRARAGQGLASRRALLFADRAKREHGLLAVRSDDLLLHADPERATELFDLEADPAAQHDLGAERPAELERFSDTLHTWRDGRDARRAALELGRASVELDEAQAASLRAMGYLGEDDG
ncbi:MAG: hypothetical protein DHS20C15_28580 [Planctomycetota bacterium]|nr:MAG: hypothetical protein DHS20C15_28580 [Planctomycetota bacterium]